MPRTAYTALVVLLLRPAGAADAQRLQQLQRIRHTYDAAYTRWLPHITLVRPFAVPPPDAGAEGDADAGAAGAPPWLARVLDTLSDDTARACARHARHRIALTDLGVFRLRRYENVHLRPSAASAPPLLALQRDIQRAAAPHLPARGRRRERFVPHASLGQAYTAEDRAAIELEAERDCRLHDGGIAVAVDHVQVMYKPSGARGPYTLYREATLAPNYEP